MAQSRKSMAVFKDKNDAYYKRLVHTRNRMLARNGIYLSPRQYRHTVDSWDISDYSSHPVYNRYKWSNVPEHDDYSLYNKRTYRAWIK